MTQIAVSNVAVEFGSTKLFDNVTFTVGAGDKWGIVGRNGTGKTTLFRMLTGQQKPTSGTVAIMPGVRVVLLEQHRDFGDAATVWEAAAGQFASLLALEQSLAEQAAALGEQSTEAEMERYGRDLERFEREGGYTIAPRVDAVLHGLGFDESNWDMRVPTLSGGQKTRVALAKALVNRPDVLLLDEPTASLDPATARDIRTSIRRFAESGEGGVLWTSHNMYEVEEVCDRVLFLSRGRVLMEGDPKTLPREHGLATLEELFITAAREPLTLAGDEAR